MSATVGMTCGGVEKACARPCAASSDGVAAVSTHAASMEDSVRCIDPLAGSVVSEPQRAARSRPGTRGTGRIGASVAATPDGGQSATRRPLPADLAHGLYAGGLGQPPGDIM